MAGRILLVDDDAATLQLVRLALEPSYETLTADSYAGALARLRTPGLLAVISDYHLDHPRRTGMDLLCMAQQISPGLRRILTSGCHPPALSEARLLGVVEYFLPKPWSPPDLIGVLDRWLARPFPGGSSGSA